MLNDCRVHMFFIISIYMLIMILHIYLLLDTNSNIYRFMIIISWILLVVVIMEQINFMLKNDEKEKPLEMMHRENYAVHYASRIFEIPIFGLLISV